MLSRIYPKAYTSSSAQANVASITFAGTVVGMLFFGYTSDHFSRKWSLFASTIIIILFAALGTGSYGAGGSPTGLLAALVAYRFFLGIGEYLPHRLIAACEIDDNRYRRRIPSRQCWLRRVDRRAEGRITKQMVHSLHQRPNRSRLPHCRHRGHHCRSHHRRLCTRLAHRLARLPRHRNHTTTFATIPSSEAARAGSFQARVSG
jgi:hypothetical protein